jgi:hypothetical protein
VIGTDGLTNTETGERRLLVKTGASETELPVDGHARPGEVSPDGSERIRSHPRLSK